jgi:hypothetical protein
MLFMLSHCIFTSSAWIRSWCIPFNPNPS